jgi:4-aminobutyrate aminotransferase-like enzyme
MSDARVPILNLNAFGGEAKETLPDDLRRMIDRRRRSFGATSVLFFHEPLIVDHASGQYITTTDGRRYLDLYNNVPSVGHGHPRVAEAVCGQLRQVNAHSRYLYDIVETYAERLLALFPAPLANVIFTCTGSEANDLALRLARLHTGKRGIVVTRAAYHGNTASVTEVSPSSYKAGEPPDYVAVVEAPDPAVHGAEVGPGFARVVSEAIRRLAANGAGFAAFIADSIFSSDGVFDGPAGFLEPVMAEVHAAGGLFIADEVQSGFGRTGEAFWGFGRHGITPDVVTLGKPMGNGYPIGGVVTRPELLALLNSQYGYFNTFGGTPAAAAAGLAVLDVLADEGLQDNARRVGASMKQRVREVAERSNIITDVRGVGLYLGVEIDRGAPRLQGAGERIVNGLRARGVLIGLAGLNANVLKIRPPLCLKEVDVETFIVTLTGVLAALDL